MQTMLPLLQQQLKLENEAVQKLDDLAQVLKEQSNGAGVREATAAIEPLLGQMDTLSQKQADYLAGAGAATVETWLAAQPPSAEHSMAGRLLAALAVMQTRLRQALTQARQLLQHSKAFIDFQINVMNQAQASDTYAPPGAATVENRRGHRMFDANV